MNKKRKKVAIFVDGVFIPSYSGAANRFHYLSQALQKNTDTDVVIILCDRGWSDIKQIKKENFSTYLLHPNTFKNIDFLKAILTKEKVDILQFATLELAIELGLPLSNQLNKHLVFEAHYDDYEFAKAIKCSNSVLHNVRYLQNTFGKYFDKVIALSKEDSGLIKNLKINKKDLAVIPSGANIFEFKKNCFKLSSKKVIFFGNLYFNVNLEALRLIKTHIYQHLKEKGFKFFIIGDISRDNKSKLEEKNFFIKGKQSDLYQNFNNSTFALAPVLSGSGIRIKILNYLNAGIPVITTTEGSRGFPDKKLLIIEDNIRSYPKRILNLLKEGEQLRAKSTEGREYIKNNMSWNIIALKVSAQYDKILAKKRKLKKDAADLASKIKFEDPPWIREVMEGKRFKRNKPFVKKGEYIKLKCGK